MQNKSWTSLKITYELLCKKINKQVTQDGWCFFKDGNVELIQFKTQRP